MCHTQGTRAASCPLSATTVGSPKVMLQPWAVLGINTPSRVARSWAVNAMLTVPAACPNRRIHATDPAPLAGSVGLSCVLAY